MPETYRVIVLPTALDDLDHITEHIKRDSPQNALGVFNRIWPACQSLSAFPNRYAVHQHRRDPAKKVRSMPVPPFIVYYRVDESQKTVRLLTIRDGRRRQPQRFR